MTEMDNLCVLTFDEMSVKTALRYDTVSDQFVGLEDYGNGNKSIKLWVFTFVTQSSYCKESLTHFFWNRLCR